MVRIGRHDRFQPLVRLPCKQRGKGMQLPHSSPSARAYSLLTDETAQTVACSRPIVASRLDYCNALLYGAPAETLNKLQRAQNNLARVVCLRDGRADAGLLLRSLHWLPVRLRITYKTAVIAHKVLATSTPAYLSELIHIAEPQDCYVPPTRLCCLYLGQGPRFLVVLFPSQPLSGSGNTLPDNTRLCKSTDTFKRHLFNTP